METALAILVGLLFAVGVYLVMQKTMLRVVIGTSVLLHGALLATITAGGLNAGMPPILLEGTEKYTDPIPQALILTAIVIGFGITAFQLVLSYRTYQEHGTDDLDELRH